MFYLPYNQQADPNWYISQMFNNLMGGAGQGYQRNLMNQDLQALLNYRAGQGQMPQLQSPQSQQMMLQGLLGGLTQSPLQQAQTAYYGAKASQALQPEELQPSQQISQKKLDMINKLQARVEAGTATEKEKAMLEKMLAGQPMVQIGLGQPASASERQAIAETRASIDALNNLKSLFDSTQTKTGPIVGRTSPIAGLFSMTTDEQEAFMAATSAFKNAIIKEITGAQMSEVEANRIMKQIPDITDPTVRWKAKWEQSKKNLEYLQKRRAEVLKQSGLRVPEGTVEIPQEIQSMSTEELKRIAGIK